MDPRITVLRGADRPVSRGAGVTSRHGLSFGAHYDPARTSFGALVAHNDDVLDPGVAYGPHEHRDVEILTWVLSGAMVHRGPSGREDVVRPGTLQHLVAGTGWRHDERCAGPEPVHLLQLWIGPGPDDPPPGEPSLSHRELDPAGGTVALHRPGVTLTVARLAAGEARPVPSARWRHVHVAHGAVSAVGALEGGADAGDAAHAWAGGTPPAADAGDSLEVTGEGALELVAGGDGADVLVVATL